jgi:hypothetical protein
MIRMIKQVILKLWWTWNVRMIMLLTWDRAESWLASRFGPDIVTPPVSIEDRSCRLACVRDFVVLATYFGKPNIWAIPLWETITAHWEWRDDGSTVYPFLWIHQGWMMQRGVVVCSRVALDWFLFWRIRVKVDVCRFGFGSGFGPRPTYVMW